MDNTRPVAVLTGASRGIGAFIAQCLSEAGYRLALGARDIQALKSMAAELPGPALAVKLDVTSSKSVLAFCADVQEAYGRVDLLVNNAGVGKFADFGELDERDYQLMFETNVGGLFRMTQGLLPSLKQARGTLIVIGADAADRVFSGGSLYCATQAAQLSLVKSIKCEHPELRVCMIRPGRTATFFAGGLAEAHEKSLSPETVAEAFQFVLNLPESVELPDLVIKTRDRFVDYL